MTSTSSPRRPRWRNLLLLALLLTPLLWPLQQLAERYYRNELTEQNRQTLDLYVANLLGTLNRYEVLPRILGDLPELRSALQNTEVPAVQDQANRLLKQLQRRTGADVIYLMDTRGMTLAASNWDAEDSFVGRNFAFRPYFRQAMEGRLGRFFGLGTTSGKRGYYFGAAVRDGEQILGVLVVKVDLDSTETLWGSTPERLLVTDNFGVVILTSEPAWRFRASRALTLDEREQIAFDQPYPTLEPTDLTLDIDAWLIQSRELKETGWTVRILAPIALIERPVRTAVAIGAATLATVLLLIGLLMQRRRHFLERLALTRRRDASWSCACRSAPATWKR